MINRSTLRTLVVLASICLFTALIHPLTRNIDYRHYDRMASWAHESVYGWIPFTPSIKTIVYSEATTHELGDWSPEKSDELSQWILDSDARGVFFYPASHPELTPQSQAGVQVVSTDLEQLGSVILDSDGVCRRVALARYEKGVWKPTSALSIVASLEKVAESEIVFLPTEIVVGGRRIATNSDYQIYVRFRASEESITARTAVSESAYQQMVPYRLESLFHSDFKGAYAKQLRDTVVLVGTGFKEAGEDIVTPVHPLATYKIDACAVETVLGGSSMRALDTVESIALIMAIVLVSYSFFSRLPTPMTILLWGLFLVGWFRVTEFLFTLGLYVEFTPALISSSLVAVYVGVLRTQQAGQALLRFGGAGAYEAARKGDESVFEEVREKTATIVFTNVLSYLKELERHGSPDQFFERRQAYAQLFSDVFRKHKGVVLDFQGDFQMVGFNVELRTDDPDHALNAVAASQEFLARLHEVTDQWWEADADEIGSGHCGICTGPVACGHVGSRRHDGGRIAQAAIGDTSNVAARLLGAAMKQKELILMAMTTVEASQGRLAYEELEAIPLKGKTQAVPIARPSGDVK